MEKIYMRLLPVLMLAGLSTKHFAQCGIPAPTVTASSTLICAGSGVFTLTAAGQSTFTTWYANGPNNPVSNGSVFVTPSLTTATTYYASQSSAASSTSLILPPQASPYPGNTRGYYFTAPANFTITGVRVPTDASTANSNIAILNFGPTVPPFYPTFTNAFTLLYLGQNIPGTAIVPVNLPVTSGDVIGVLGDRGGVNSYANGSFPTTIGNMNVTLERLGMQYVLGTTSPLELWTEPLGASISRVELYANAMCTTSLAPVTVVVSNPPQISIMGPPTALCSGATSTTLTASGATSYTWSNGPTVPSVSLAPSSTTTYTVVGADTYGCINSAVYEVSVVALPSITITPTRTVICTGQSAVLNLSGASTYTWSSGFNTPALNISPNVTTTYSVSGTDAYGCMDIETITIPVSPFPTVTVNSSRINNIICVGQTAVLTASGGVTYSWSTGAGTQSISVSPTATQNFTAIGTNAAGCSKQAIITVIVSACTGIDENSMSNGFINIFPNPSNGQLNIQSSVALHEVVVTDIAGRTVLSRQLDALTDVKLNLEELKAGVYFIDFPQDLKGNPVKIIKN